MFGCYLKKTRTGFYDFKHDEKPSSLEGGAVKTSNIVFHPPSLDWKIFGSIGKSHSRNGTLNRNSTLNGTNGHANGVNGTNLNSDILEVFTTQTN